VQNTLGRDDAVSCAGLRRSQAQQDSADFGAPVKGPREGVFSEFLNVLFREKSDSA